MQADFRAEFSLFFTVVNIGSNYWEGNNQYLSKHFKCKKYSLREICREDKERIGTSLVLDFLDANGKSREIFAGDEQVPFAFHTEKVYSIFCKADNTF